MKKIIVMIAMLLLLPCTYSTMAIQAQRLIMGGQYNDPSDETRPSHRSPVSPIYVYQDGHTFTFDSSLVGEVVEVLSGDALLYTVVIGTDGKVILSDDISGEVEIRLLRGRVTYHVTVEL